MSADQKVALITGGSRGIGLGIAVVLAKEGWSLAINGLRDETEVAETLEQLRNFGAKTIYCQGSVSSTEDREAILLQIRQELGQLNALINNAGIAPEERKDLLEATEESFDLLMDTNLKGPYFLTQAVANWMIAQKKNDAEFTGCIVNISSISAHIISTNRGDYCLTKAGIHMATKLWAARMAEFGVPVYEVQPGVIHSDMTAGVQEKYDRLIANGLTHERRWGEPEDIGKAVAMLLRGELSYATGQVLNIDGGMTIREI